MSERITTGRVDIDMTSSSDGSVVSMNGQIDERAQLVPFAESVGDPVAIDLEKVSFINSVGVREWIRMLRAMKGRGLKVRLERCSEAMIQQMNMIVEAKGAADVASFYAPYYCDGCGFEGSMLVDVDAHRPALGAMEMPPMACPECKEPMEFSDIPERYLLFLQTSSNNLPS